MDTKDRLDLDELLHPAQASTHPSEVVNDPYLTLNEKRDACAIEAAPDCVWVPKSLCASTTSWKRSGRWTAKLTRSLSGPP